MEVWKDIVGYEGLYQVSDWGNVRSLNYNHTGKTRLLKPAKDSRGYLYVCLSKGGKQKFMSVHRLVAKAFIPNPLNLPVINHRDENPANNVVDNLEWCTQKYNVNYGTCGAKKAAKLSKVVLQYDKSGNFVREWPSTMEVQRQKGFASSYISACCLGKLKSAYGFIWKYKEVPS